MTQLAAPRAGEQVIPAPPGHDLMLTIECTSAPTERLGVLHHVIVHPDWSVETPHSVEAEGVARSMGGWCTCLYFAETVVSAYRVALIEVSSPEGLRDGSALSPARVAALCKGRSWTVEDPDAAAEPLAKALLNAAGGAWSRWGDPRYVDDADLSYSLLWKAGILTTQVEAIARQLPSVAWPLSTDFYEAAHFGHVDRGWLIDVITCYPDQEFSSWAANQTGAWRKIPVESIWRMFQLGLAAQDAIDVVEAAIPVERVAELAARTSGDGATAARWLLLWARVGVVPTNAHYDLLTATRVLLERPPPWKSDWTARALRTFGPDAPSRTELVVMLALTSDLGLIGEAVRRGVRTATEIRFTQMIHRRSNQK